MQWFFLIPATLFLLSCSTPPPPTLSSPAGKHTEELRTGFLSIIQGPTSDKETLINVVVPHLKNYSYELSHGQEKWEIKPYSTVTAKDSYYKVDKFHLRHLNPKTQYTLTIFDTHKGITSAIDQRLLSTLDLQKTAPRFAATSCMSDEWKFEPYIQGLWKKLDDQNVDFVIFSGDTVYVDSFGLVERKKATEKDLWYRYTSTMQKIPFYHQPHLTPVFATWDDHDYGTNDGDRNSQTKLPALKIFQAFFQGEKLDDGVWQPTPYGVASVFLAYGQQFVMMDDRTFRQPNADQKVKEAYGHWGEKQHRWLMSLLKNKKPTWIINGNQVVSGKALGFKESLQESHSMHFEQLKKDLKLSATPFVFLTGDVHFSEIMRLSSDLFGFETFELTSSAMHSYANKGWENPLRIPGKVTMEYNFMVITPKAIDNTLHIQVDTLGINSTPYFSQTLDIQR